MKLATVLAVLATTLKWATVLIVLIAAVFLLATISFEMGLGGAAIAMVLVVAALIVSDRRKPPYKG